MAPGEKGCKEALAIGPRNYFRRRSSGQEVRLERNVFVADGLQLGSEPADHDLEGRLSLGSVI